MCLYTSAVITKLCYVYLLLGRLIEQFGYNLMRLYFKIMYVVTYFIYHIH